MKAPLIASVITSAITLYILRGQPSSTQIGISTAVGFGTYHALSQTSDEVSKTTKLLILTQPQTVLIKMLNIQVKLMHVLCEKRKNHIWIYE